MPGMSLDTRMHGGSESSPSNDFWKTVYQAMKD
jgi:hypothetical protein